MADRAGWMFHVWRAKKKEKRKKKKKFRNSFQLTFERPEANQSVGERKRGKSIDKE